jgi:hypothetical protein
MLRILGSPRKFCDGLTRDFLRVGALGLGSAALPGTAGSCPSAAGIVTRGKAVLLDSGVAPTIQWKAPSRVSDRSMRLPKFSGAMFGASRSARMGTASPLPGITAPPHVGAITTSSIVPSLKEGSSV